MQQHGYRIILGLILAFFATMLGKQVYATLDDCPGCGL